MPLHVSTRADDSDKHEFDVNNIIYHKGILYSGADDGKIKAWAPDLKFLAEVQAHPCSVYALAASDDTLFSCSNEGTVKTWELKTLKEKSTLIKDTQIEFWMVRYDKGVLYVGDDQGNVRLYKDNKLYGTINVAEPVKDMALSNNLLFSSKDNDVVITDLHLDGEKVQFGVKGNLVGRAPLSVIDNFLVFSSRDGKDLVLAEISGQINKTRQINASHEMIINSLASANWDGKQIVFSGGWEKNVKQWNLVDGNLQLASTCNVDIVVNTLTIGEKGQIYAAGSDGHIVRLDA